MKRRREMSVFGLSFLDCICCGFGAVILLFVMVNSRTDIPPPETPPPPTLVTTEPVAAPPAAIDRSAEITDLRLSVQTSLARLQALQKADDDLTARAAAASERTTRMRQEATELRSRQSNAATRESEARNRVTGLQGDLLALQKEVEQLRAALAANATPEPPKGEAAREFRGEGDRQYLTGMKVGGQRILLLLDCSASMLDRRIVEIIRLRNQPPEQARQAAKWQRAVRSTEWLLAQLPAESQFQIYGFNEKAFPLIENRGGVWLPVKDTAAIDAAVAAIRQRTPTAGTSLEAAFTAARELSPMPDNVILLTDGLPTMGGSRGLRKTVSPDRRLGYFEDAARSWPRDIPINTVLFPMEGDPDAANAFWLLSVATNGSFLCPAEDWP